MRRNLKPNNQQRNTPFQSLPATNYRVLLTVSAQPVSYWVLAKTGALSLMSVTSIRTRSLDSSSLTSTQFWAPSGGTNDALLVVCKLVIFRYFILVRVGVGKFYCKFTAKRILSLFTVSKTILEQSFTFNIKLLKWHGLCENCVNKNILHKMLSIDPGVDKHQQRTRSLRISPNCEKQTTGYSEHQVPGWKENRSQILNVQSRSCNLLRRPGRNYLRLLCPEHEWRTVLVCRSWWWSNLCPSHLKAKHASQKEALPAQQVPVSDRRVFRSNEINIALSPLFRSKDLTFISFQ